MFDNAATISSAEFEAFALERARELDPDLVPSAMRVGYTLVRAASALVQAEDTAVHRPAGWSWAGFRVMFTVWLFGSVEARSIARLAGVTRQTTSSVLATLERDGYVRRERSSTEDRRLVSIQLSEAGRQAVEAAFRGQHAVEQAWFAALTPEEQETLADLLHRVVTQAPPRTAPVAITVRAAAS
jgi:DNA-binding MarR family transcriptional regulator